MIDIHIGGDGEDLRNNPICMTQLNFMALGAANITCVQTAFGDWVIITKSSSSTDCGQLAFKEVRVFGRICKYRS